MALIKHGAAIFATTFSDGSLAIEKCDPYREGYNECFSYLAGEQGVGRPGAPATLHRGKPAKLHLGAAQDLLGPPTAS